ncbi:MAG: hypothetical protein ATN35_08405 [Epulopiscium sp. Nele67-Bin004]|nr:MAG: hypothetical protein ATN35_08405 [Epulopiscium sp. Nele67-Bin004]
MKQKGGLILITLVLVMMIMYFAYDFNFHMIYVSNAFFVTGALLFFPGLVMVSGAEKLFETVKYHTKKFSRRTNPNDFKTIDQYREYQRIRQEMKPKDHVGMDIFVIGVAYIMISFLMSWFFV